MYKIIKATQQKHSLIKCSQNTGGTNWGKLCLSIYRLYVIWLVFLFRWLQSRFSRL